MLLALPKLGLFCICTVMSVSCKAVVSLQYRESDSPTAQNFKPLIVEEDFQLIRGHREWEVGIHPPALQLRRQLKDLKICCKGLAGIVLGP